MRSIEALTEAIADLDKSQKVFAELASKKNPVGYNSTKAKERETYSAATRRVSEKKIHEAEVFQKQRQERLMEMKQRQIAREMEQQELLVQVFSLIYIDEKSQRKRRPGS